MRAPIDVNSPKTKPIYYHTKINKISARTGAKKKKKLTKSIICHFPLLPPPLKIANLTWKSNKSVGIVIISKQHF